MSGTDTGAGSATAAPFVARALTAGGLRRGLASEAVLKTAALAIAALRGGSQSSCTPLYTPVARRRAPCSAVARDIFETTSQ
jgi:hypothetical protein